MSLKATILVIGICIRGSAIAQEAAFFSRSWTFERGHAQMIDDPITIGKNNEFTYAMCDSQKNNQQNCTITLEYFNSDGFVFKDRCSVQLKAKTGNKIPGLLMRSYFGDKVLFSYVEPVEARVDVYYRLLDMSTCHYSENKIVVKTGSGYDLEDALHTDLALMPHTVQYADGSYELFTSDQKLCKAARCRHLVNSKNPNDKNPVPYLPVEYLVKKVRMYSARVNESYFAVVTEYTKLGSDLPDESFEVKILYAMPGGAAKELLHLDNSKRLCDIDADRGFLSVCWTTDFINHDNAMNVRCKQFGPDGELFDETFGFPYVTKTLKIKTIDHGRFVMLTEECNDRSCSKGSKFYLKCVNRQGYHSRSLEIDGFDPMSMTNYHKIRSTEISLDEGSLCVSVAVEQTINVGNTVSWKLMRKCVPGKYLDKQLNGN